MWAKWTSRLPYALPSHVWSICGINHLQKAVGSPGLFLQNEKDVEVTFLANRLQWETSSPDFPAYSTGRTACFSFSVHPSWGSVLLLSPEILAKFAGHAASKTHLQLVKLTFCCQQESHPRRHPGLLCVSLFDERRQSDLLLYCCNFRS